MTNNKGFTLIELIIFIIISSLLASTIILALRTALLRMPTIHYQLVAAQTAKQCMEWFIGQRRMKGYSTLPCPSSSTPSYCTAPSGYSISTTVSCTTISSDANYKTITVTVSGLGDTTLSSLIAAY